MTTTSGFTAGQFRFSELIGILNDVVLLVDQVVGRMRESEQFQDTFQQVTDAVPELFEGAIAQVVENIESGQYDAPLVDHQLHDGDPAWEFKRLGYLQARERYDTWMGEGEPLEDGDPEDLPWWRKWARKAKGPLAWANVILRSVAAVVPGGGAANEIKDGVEAAVDELS